MVENISKDGMANYKLVMLGESGVGKTCIVNKYISGTFVAGEAIPTIGSNYSSKTEVVKPQGVLQEAKIRL